ncbi:MAG: DNA mismatch repair endonuclease MutL [Spirochaetota bacterium]
MGIVRALAPEVYTRIAAGEVIEGPFSVVRELSDNALDAESGRITVSIREGGVGSITVSDDGEGMSAEDAELAVRKHTTSKIRTLQDIGAIASLGFRGEALYAVCAVSDFTLVTAQAGSAHGTRVTCTGGERMRVEPCAANPGTTVTARNLFFNLPARRKFLRGPRSETARVKDEVLKKAIGFFGYGFALRVDDRAVLNLQPAGELQERIGEIWGSSLAESLRGFSLQEKDFRVHGLLSDRRHTLPNRGGQYLFINRRPVSDRSLSHALNSPFKNVLPAGRFPYAFVFVEMDPGLLDVNVHPAKREVKVRAPDRLYGALRRAVSAALERGGQVPGSVLPEGAVPAADAAPSGWGAVRERGGDLFAFSAGEKVRGGVVFGEPDAGQSDRTAAAGQPERAGGQPVFRGCLFGTYLLFDQGESLLIVDQHAAHERVLYERFKQHRASGGAAGGRPTKRLLVPINFTPPRGRYGDMLESLDRFREAGIELEPFGDESFNLTALPAYVPDRREEELCSLFFEEYYQGGMAPEEMEELLLQLAACRSAVKEGDRLSEREALALLADLRSTRVPQRCPHGRPTAVSYPREHFEKLFERT